MSDIPTYPQPRPASRVLVTGASTGIGEATVRQLRASGWAVIAVARRRERLEKLAEETGCEFFACDLTDRVAVEEMVADLLSKGALTAVVNNAGGAIGTDSVADGKVADWEQMYQRNVVTALNVTQATLPALRENGGDLLYVTSTAALDTYPGGGGYVAAKHAEQMIPLTVRQELVGEPVRLIEIAPGMVKTPEFSLNRLGSRQAAEQVYRGVEKPLVAADIADLISWCLSRPPHVNIDRVIIRPVAQATNTLVARSED